MAERIFSRTWVCFVLLAAGLAFPMVGCVDAKVDIPDYYRDEDQYARQDDHREDRDRDHYEDRDRKKRRERKLGKSEAYNIAKELVESRGMEADHFKIKDKKIDGVYWILFERERKKYRHREQGRRQKHLAVRVTRGRKGKTHVTLYMDGEQRDFGRRMDDDKVDKKEAYALAGKRMFWPITSSTATTLAAFLPFLFWNSIAGKYMSFLPKTLIFVLVASLLIALVFLPVIGGLLGGRPKGDTEAMKALAGADGDPLKAPGITGGYARLASWMVKRPIIVVGMAAFIVVGIWQWFGATEHRVEFFLDTEPEQVFVYVRARGNLSSAEMNGLGIEVESLINDIPSIQSIFTTSGPGGGVGGFGNSSPPEDTVSTLFVDFKPFGERENGRLIMAEIQRRLENVPGVMIEVRALENGPPVGKDVQVELTSNNPLALDTAARLVRRQLDETPGLVEVEDTLPLPGIEWELRVDREQAGRFGADVSQLGAAVQLVTNGVLVGRYRPNDSDEEIDIREIGRAHV